MWRIVKVADSIYDVIDIVHCQEYNKSSNDEFISCDLYNKEFFYSGWDDFIKFFGYQLPDNCPKCKELIPEHIKLQVKLLL